jgi:cyclic dehypoxanthinyl futalosine synthase
MKIDFTPGQRLNKATGLKLLQDVPLGELMRMAHQFRSECWPGNTVTFVHDTNPNYTNICTTCCSFCAFHREPTDQDAYSLSPDELVAKVQTAYQQGASTVLLQGGHNPEVRLCNWIEYIRSIRVVCPDIHIHPFDPAEIVSMAKLENMPVREILSSLYDEGIDTLPGGGAEVLSDRVRSKISPHKATTDEWLKVMEEAHQLGYRTTATMMFGHIETDEEIIEHLFHLRELQDRTMGFQSFIPWSFKPGGSCLGNDLRSETHPAKYVRIIAVARLFLDNFPHIQSSWFSQSISAGQLGLLAGADDFGGVLVEENVLKTTGHVRKTTLEKVLDIIRDSGFTPARRDSYYKIVENFSEPE